ncbi:ethanolamine ammonia-lyase subunit EutC [Vibrio sp. WXL210]|uniref:ethanolamine ammonia-lyase subunit EutC n=1 Tax=Vibrio sp. WXL210 TaxID=3450709 RepID=UPI003EC93CA6
MTTKPTQATSPSSGVTETPWQALRQHTSARVAIGRSGTSIPTKELLKFQLDHAKAMDAVHAPLDIQALVTELAANEAICTHTPMPPKVLETKASDRLAYLQRPDWGRELSDKAWQVLTVPGNLPELAFDLVIVIADGLSAVAVQSHAVEVLDYLIPRLASDTEPPWRIAPICIVTQGRVAVGDDIAQRLNARAALVLIGERPGLSSPDSMGIYLTWGAARGTKDAQRNCISNVRPQGLSYSTACERAVYLLNEARRIESSGIVLKDRSDSEAVAVIEGEQPQKSFLVTSTDTGCQESKA